MAKRSKYPPALIARTLAAWAVTLVLFFPLGWLMLTAFKTELQAISVPPLLIFTPTLENFSIVQERSDYLLYAQNSFITSVVSTILGLMLAWLFNKTRSVWPCIIVHCAYNSIALIFMIIS